MLTRVLHAIKHAVYHNVRRQLPLLRRGGFHRPHRTDNARAVKHDVNGTELRDRSLHQLSDVILNGHIAKAKDCSTVTT